MNEQLVFHLLDQKCGIVNLISCTKALQEARTGLCGAMLTVKVRVRDGHVMGLSPRR